MIKIVLLIRNVLAVRGLILDKLYNISLKFYARCERVDMGQSVQYLLEIYARCERVEMGQSVQYLLEILCSL